ncbi:MAG: hypothetical protein EHM41_16150 [Chloroflexi bacterium]|nr:MAG: hypothetical protein EHM41_16150 [Chloroflexota bacterium]
MSAQNESGVVTPVSQAPVPTVTDTVPATSVVIPTEVNNPAMLPSKTQTLQSPVYEYNGNDLPGCSLGTALRTETIDVVLKNKNHIGLIMSATSFLAQQYFPKFEGSIRIIGAPSLDEFKDKGTRAVVDNVPFEGLGYGLETSNSTPDEEWRDLLGSTHKANVIADDLNKMLVMAPGFKLMSDNEDMYARMALEADIWIFQTQQLQKGPPGLEYRGEVERIINLIRSENPEIRIWAQITLPPDREPDASEWLDYRQSIVDLVDGTYIGVYTWDTVDPEILVQTINTIFETACTDRD